MVTSLAKLYQGSVCVCSVRLTPLLLEVEDMLIWSRFGVTPVVLSSAVRVQVLKYRKQMCCTMLCRKRAPKLVPLAVQW